MRHPVILGLALAAALVPRPAAAATLSLREAVDRALARNPRIAMTRAAEDAALARRGQARAAWLPQVSLSQAWTKSDNPVFVFGSLLEQGRFGQQHFDPRFLNDPDPLTNYRFAATVRYALFDQLRRLSAGSQAGAALGQAKLASDTAAQATRLEVVERYTGVVVAAARADAARKAWEAAESGLARIRDRHDTGLVARSDLLAAETQAAEFLQQRIEAEGGVRIARAALAATLDMPLSELPDVEATPSDPDFVLPDVEDALRQAREVRNELASSRLSEKQADLGVRTAAGQFLPRVDGFYSYGASGESFGDHDDDTTYGAVVTWNILDPGRLGRLAEARAHRAAAAAATRQLESGIDVETLTAWERARSAQQRIEVARRAFVQAEETMRIVRDRYEEGLTSITEELRAEAALLRAAMNLAGARSDLRVGYANLLRATGRLEDVDAFE